MLSGALVGGFAQVAAINSDSPSLPAAYLAEAFTQLDQPAVDAVFGPCDDGGYYLIGWKRPHPALVRDVAMSRPDTLAQTLAVAAIVVDAKSPAAAAFYRHFGFVELPGQTGRWLLPRSHFAQDR